MGRGVAWGSYLNGPMKAEEAPHAYEAMQEAIGAPICQRCSFADH